MAYKSQNGFAVLETFLIVVILAIIGGTGYFVWHSRQHTDKVLHDSNIAEQQAFHSTNQSAENPIAIVGNGKLPSSWQIENTGENSKQVVLSSKDNACSVQVLVSAEKSTPEKQHVAEKAAVEQKGYTYIELPQTSLSLSTASGLQRLTAYNSKLTLDNNILYQRTAYFIKSNKLVSVTLSCKTSDMRLKEAVQALEVVNVDLG